MWVGRSQPLGMRALHSSGKNIIRHIGRLVDSRRLQLVDALPDAFRKNGRGTACWKPFPKVSSPRNWTSRTSSRHVKENPRDWAQERDRVDSLGQFYSAAHWFRWAGNGFFNIWKSCRRTLNGRFFDRRHLRHIGLIVFEIKMKRKTDLTVRHSSG